MNAAQLRPCSLIVDVDLVAKGEKFRLDEVFGRAGLIVNVVGIRPREYPLFYQQLHTTASFLISYRMAAPNARKMHSPLFNRQLCRIQPPVEGIFLKNKQTSDSFSPVFMA